MKNNKFKRYKLSFNILKNFHLLFIMLVAIILACVFGIIVIAGYFLNKYDLIDIHLDKELAWFVILMLSISSIIIGLIVSFIYRILIMKPIKKIIDGMAQLSDGIYDTSIRLGSNSALKELSECFNDLAQELKKNELLSIDFINNFSHELKTPLVSINGLISLMKQPNFPESKKLEYLNIIEEESNRLATITTNILNLSKIENQKILTDKELYNISEQIRNCVLLLQKKWEKKNLEPVLDFDEYYITGNIDLLKQIWVNLIDNAIKFSYDNSTFKISIQDELNTILVKIENESDNIQDIDKERLFQKFYQVDDNKTGNGIGLSIVKKIVDLHEGEVNISSENNIVIVSVRLLKNF